MQKQIDQKSFHCLAGWFLPKHRVLEDAVHVHEPGIQQQNPSQLNWCKVDGEGELIRPAAHYWLLITAFSPETHAACSFTPSQPPPLLPLHYWCTARGSSSSRHACHGSELAMSSSFSLCSFLTALALLLLLLLLSAHMHSLRHAEPWELSIAFLLSELSCTHFLPFSCLLGTF